MDGNSFLFCIFVNKLRGVILIYFKYIPLIFCNQIVIIVIITNNYLIKIPTIILKSLEVSRSNVKKLTISNLHNNSKLWKFIFK